MFVQQGCHAGIVRLGQAPTTKRAQFVFGIAQQPARLRVCRKDAAVAFHQEHGIDAVFEQRPVTRFAFAQCVGECASLGNVFIDCYAVDDLAFGRQRTVHLAEHLLAACRRARQLIPATQFLHQQPGQHHRGQREGDQYHDRDFFFLAPAGQYFVFAQADLHHQRHIGYPAGAVDTGHAVHGADAARCARTTAREEVFQRQVSPGGNTQPGGRRRHAGDQLTILMHQSDHAVASDFDVTVNRLERARFERHDEGAGETAIGIVEPPAPSDKPCTVAAPDDGLADIEPAGMRAMPVEDFAIREIPWCGRMHVGVLHQHAACVEHEQRAGVGQLAEFLREQGVHAGAGGVAQRRYLQPHFAQTAQRSVRRLQHPGGTLLHYLCEVARGAFGIAQAGVSRLGQGKECKGEEGNDQQGGKPRDQVEKKTLSRAFDFGRRLRRHGNRVVVNIAKCTSDVPRPRCDRSN